MSIVKLNTNKDNIKDNKKTTGSGRDSIPGDPEEAKSKQAEDVVVVFSSSRFFRDLPEGTIRKLCDQYGTQAVTEKVRALEEQYSNQEMENPGGLLTDALKRDYLPPQKVARKREAEEVVKKRMQEQLVEQELIVQEEEVRKRVSEDKAKMSPKERVALKEKALEEIRNTEGIKEEFVTDILIEAKENEILMAEMEDRDSE